jgi:hypothetical protein
MKLTKQDKEIKKLGQEAKGFLESSLFQTLSKHLSNKLEEEYPKPNKKGWEEQYRYARAYEAAAADIVEYIVGLKNQHTHLLEQEKLPETSIDEA